MSGGGTLRDILLAKAEQLGAGGCTEQPPAIRRHTTDGAFAAEHAGRQQFSGFPTHNNRNPGGHRDPERFGSGERDIKDTERMKNRSFPNVPAEVYPVV